MSPRHILRLGHSFTGSNAMRTMQIDRTILCHPAEHRFSAGYPHGKDARQDRAVSLWRGCSENSGEEGEQWWDHRALTIHEIDFEKVEFVDSLPGENGAERVWRLAHCDDLSKKVRLDPLVAYTMSKMARTEDHSGPMRKMCKGFLLTQRGVPFFSLPGMIFRGEQGSMQITTVHICGLHGDDVCVETYDINSLEVRRAPMAVYPQA